MSKATTRKRVNITLALDTLRLLDRVASKGERSHVIDAAFRSYISNKNHTAIRELLEEGAQARAQRDLGLAEEWFEVESEAWPSRKRSIDKQRLVKRLGTVTPKTMQQVDRALQISMGLSGI